MRELTDIEIQEISGGLSITEGLAALGVVAGAAALSVTAPFAAGAVLVGVIGIAVIDIAGNLSC